MICLQKLTIKGAECVRTYSDALRYIKSDQNGEVYMDAIDPADSCRTYSETEETYELSDEDRKEQEQWLSSLQA